MGKKGNQGRYWRVRCAYAFLGILVLVAILRDVVSNDKPLWYEISETESTTEDVFVNWKSLNYQWSLWPPIPFSAKSLDLENSNYAPPMSEQNNRFVHYMGTDLIGRDIAAGMVSGTRVTVFVAGLSVLISILIGIPLGLIAGFFGDHSLRLNWVELMIIVLYFTLLMYVGIFFSSLSMSFKLFIVALGAAIVAFLTKAPFSNLKKVNIPLDLLIMRLLEVFTSLPALLILLVLSAMWASSGILSISLIIGLLIWPKYTQLTRAESMRIKESSFVMNGRALGIPQYRLLWHHVLPNLLTPVVIAMAFSLSAVVLLESTLSFLGIGLALEEQTWGSILSEARRNFAAWWLALFPGLAIFMTVVSLNVVGEDLLNRLNPLRKIRR